MRDLHNHIDPKRAISPAVAGTDNTPIVSQILDTLGYESAELVISIGVNTDANATFAVLIEDGNNSALTDNVAVSDTYLLGTEAQAGWDFSDDNEVRKIGYNGGNRYVRATVTPTGNDAGNIYVSAVWILGHPHTVPTANPPV